MRVTGYVPLPHRRAPALRLILAACCTLPRVSPFLLSSQPLQSSLDGKRWIHSRSATTSPHHISLGRGKKSASAGASPAGLGRGAKLCTMADSVGGSAPQKTAIITGVGTEKGIGRALAHCFLQRGYRVGGIDLKLHNPEGDAALKQHSGHFAFAKADVAQPEEVSSAVGQILENLGNPQVHVLINCAGYAPDGETCSAFLPTGDTSSVAQRLESFKKFIDVNLTGAFICTETCLPFMAKADSGGASSVIHISSTRALMSEPNSEGYAASKGGLCALAHAQAISLGSQRVRVNSVLPGWIDTGGYPITEGDASFHPVGRVGIPTDVAQLCLFLADDSKSGFITGQQFVVDGGVTSKMVYPE